jgi:ATP-dependent RNA helicase DOB1
MVHHTYVFLQRSVILIIPSKMTDVYEGSLIRVFRRLEENLRQMAEASKVMGSEELEKKFEEALTKVKRDIVAAQSLYL